MLFYKIFKIPTTKKKIRLADAQEKSARIMLQAYEMWGEQYQLDFAQSQLNKAIKNLGFLNREHMYEYYKAHNLI